MINLIRRLIPASGDAFSFPHLFIRPIHRLKLRVEPVSERGACALLQAQIHLQTITTEESIQNRQGRDAPRGHPEVWDLVVGADQATGGSLSGVGEIGGHRKAGRPHSDLLV